MNQNNPNLDSRLGHKVVRADGTILSGGAWAASKAATHEGGSGALSPEVDPAEAIMKEASTFSTARAAVLDFTESEARASISALSRAVSERFPEVAGFKLEDCSDEDTIYGSILRVDTDSIHYSIDDIDEDRIEEIEEALQEVSIATPNATAEGVADTDEFGSYIIDLMQTQSLVESNADRALTARKLIEELQTRVLMSELQSAISPYLDAIPPGCYVVRDEDGFAYVADPEGRVLEGDVMESVSEISSALESTDDADVRIAVDELRSYKFDS